MLAVPFFQEGNISMNTYRTLFPLFEELEGERIIVRPYRQGDAQALFEAVAESRDHIRPWLPFADAHQTIEESQDFVIRKAAQWLLREDLTLSIWERESGRFLGGTGLHIRNWDARYFEIGYWLRASAEGYGYMTENVKLLTDYAFTQMGVNRLEIRCDEKNKRSAAVPRRLGFVQEALRRNDMVDTSGKLRNTFVFIMTPEDYQRVRPNWK
jgi:RimJ/RimL family protein N-acetyltransferase